MHYHNSYQKLDIYKIACQLSDWAWTIYIDIPQPQKFHMGDQLLRSVDSIAANIAEGHGRYHFKDQIRFLYYSRGSLFEAIHWLNLLCERGLLCNNKKEEIIKLTDLEGKKLNQFINYLKTKTQ